MKNIKTSSYLFVDSFMKYERRRTEHVSPIIQRSSPAHYLWLTREWRLSPVTCSRTVQSTITENVYKSSEKSTQIFVFNLGGRNGTNVLEVNFGTYNSCSLAKGKHIWEALQRICDSSGCSNINPLINLALFVTKNSKRQKAENESKICESKDMFYMQK